MKILVIGATRGIGRALLESALDAGHEVTALARSPSKIPTGRPGLRVEQGDVLEPESLYAAVNGQQAVCSCIGVPVTFKPVEVFSRGAVNVIAAMKESGVDRLIAVTGIGAGDSRGHGGFLYDCIVQPLLLRTIYEDKDREEAIIKKSGLDWLIVRPGMLTNGKRTGRYRVVNDLTGVKVGKISRLDVADFILGQLAHPTHFGQTPVITY